MLIEAVLKFIFEVGVLRNTPRSGWRRIGLVGESVAEHAFRTAQLAYIIALMEGYEEPDRVAVMALFHDNGEARSGDIDKVAKQYVKVDADKIALDQTAALGEIGRKIYLLMEEEAARESRAAIIVRDADMLEMAFRAYEINSGCDNCRANPWIAEPENFQTQSARDICAALIKGANLDEWWKCINQ